MMLRSYHAGAGRWLEATAISLVVHGATAAALFSAAGFVGQDLAPPRNTPTTVTVTLQTSGDGDRRQLQIAGEKGELTALEPELPEMGDGFETLALNGLEVLTALPLINPIVPLEDTPITLVPTQPEISPTETSPSEQTGSEEATQPPTDSDPEETPAGGTPPAAPPDPDLADLIARFRVQLSEPCTVGIPQRSANGELAVTLIGLDDAALDRFAQLALQDASFDAPVERRVFIDERQCPALNYIRQNRDYPASRIALQLDSQVVNSGESLTGLVRAGADEQVTVLLVDDNGIVQNLHRFMSFGVDGRARFDVPISRNGEFRPTQQLIIAVSAGSSVDPFDSRSGQAAKDAFDKLPSGLAERSAIAITAFEIR